MLQTLTLLPFLLGMVNEPDSTHSFKNQISNLVSDALRTRLASRGTIAVIVEPGRNTTPTLDERNRLENLAGLLDAFVKASGNEPANRVAIDAARRKLDVVVPTRPSDVARLRRFTPIDYLLSATWSRRNGKQIVRFAISSANRVVWTQVVTGEADEELNEIESKTGTNGTVKSPTGEVGLRSKSIELVEFHRLVGSGGIVTIDQPPSKSHRGTSNDSDPDFELAAKRGGDQRHLPGTGSTVSKQTKSEENGKAAASTNKGTSANGGGGAKQSTVAGNSSTVDSPDNSTRAEGQEKPRPPPSKTGGPKAIPNQGSPTTAGSIAKVPEANRKVLEFATANLGRQVGNGECWTLAAEALAFAEAQSPRGYTFGKELGSKEPVFPGDIMQFTSCRFQDRNFTAAMGLPNHTAIVYAVDGDRTTFIHQNFGSRMVTLLTLDMTTLVSGNYMTFRPQSRANQ